MFRSILVPLDGSQFGEHALQLAGTLARRSGAALHLVHVHVPQEVTFGEPVLLIPEGVDESIKQQRLQYLQGLARRLTGGLTAPPTCSVLQGTVAPSLEKHTVSVHGDLVVMTTHGRGLLSRAWFGSVTDDLVRNLTVPLLLVQPEEKNPDVNADVAMKRMVIALDGSTLSEQILGPASDLAQLLQAECTLVRVIQPLVRGHELTVDVAMSQMDTELLNKLKEYHQQDQAEATRYLDARAAELSALSLKVQTRLEVHDQPAAALLAAAKNLPADVLSLATHGRGGILRLFLGSVADKVARGVHCPVLVYRPRQV
jgi:nucleotide-binding universal stress UspA family protein